ncbi:MAG: twin-arginine translocation signal domain-containing protein, partial [Acidobacteriota bacterium]
MSMDPRDPQSTEAPDHSSSEEPKGISRRSLLTGGAAAAAALAAGAVGLDAQITGVRPGGSTIPYRLPKGAMTYLDRKEYISNMEIISYTPGITISAGEPLMNLWARGKQRMLPGGGGWLDITDPKKPVVIPPAGGGGRGGRGGG